MKILINSAERFYRAKKRNHAQGTADCLPVLQFCRSQNDGRRMAIARKLYPEAANGNPPKIEESRLVDEIGNNSQGCWWYYQNGRESIIPGDGNSV